MSSRRWIALAAAWSAAVCACLMEDSFHEYAHPHPDWMTAAPSWYDDAIIATMYAITATACIVYLVRRRNPTRCAALVRWRDKVELRVVLYSLAVVLALQIPLGILQAVRAANDNPPTSCRSLICLYPTGSWIAPPFAIAIIYYDRRRIRQETRLISGACLSCGYLLTGNTSGICPECGQPTWAPQPAAPAQDVGTSRT